MSTRRNKILSNVVTESRLTDEQLREQFEEALSARDSINELTGLARGKAEAERRFGSREKGRD